MREILEAESKAVLNIPVTDAYEEAVKLIVEQVKHEGGKLVTSGMGKCGQIADNIATTFSSTGIPAMLCLAGVEEDGGNACRREGGGDVVGNLATLAHARGDEFATLVLYLLNDEVDGLFIGIGNRYVKDGLALGLQNFTH